MATKVAQSHRGATVSMKYLFVIEDTHQQDRPFNWRRERLSPLKLEILLKASIFTE
jgi:hypothetical protein